MKFYLGFQANCYLFVTQGRKTVLNRLHIGHSYLTHSFILRKEEAPVCVILRLQLNIYWFNALTCWKSGKNIYFKQKSLHSLFRNVNPEIIFDFLSEIGVFYKI